MHNLLIFIYFFSLNLSLFARGPRLIALTPQVTEIIFDLGKGGDLVGCSDGSFYPASAQSLPKVGSWFLPNFERVLALHPTVLLLDSYVEKPHWLERAREFKLETFEFQVESLKSLQRSIANFLSRFYQEAPPPLPPFSYRKKPFRFALVLSFSPMVLGGDRTFLSSVLEEMGGINILKSQIPYPQISEEWLLHEKPDRIFALDLPSQGTLIQAPITYLNPEQFARANPKIREELWKVLP